MTSLKPEVEAALRDPKVQAALNDPLARFVLLMTFRVRKLLKKMKVIE